LGIANSFLAIDEQGVLTITLPKSAEAQKRTKKVSINEPMMTALAYGLDK
jgi:hypothetical protein